MVSIIIPTFNRETLVVETLNSVINQTSSDWECIIVDDGSIDNTIDIISEFCKEDDRFKILKRNREPKGAATCRNIGASHSKYDYLIFLDSDDIMAPWCIENRTKFIKENKELEFALFPAISFENNTITSKSKYRSIIDTINPLKEFLSYQPTWQTSCVLWRKDIFIKINGWDEQCLAWQDGEVHIRLLNIATNYKWATRIPDIFLRIDTINSITKDYSINKLYNIFNTYNKIYNHIDNTELKNHFKKTTVNWLYNLMETINLNSSMMVLKYIQRNYIINIGFFQNSILFLYAILFKLTSKILFIRGAFYKIRNYSIIFPNRNKIKRNYPQLTNQVYKELILKFNTYNTKLIKIENV